MKRIIVSHEHLQTRIAFVENDRIEEYHIETADKERITGSIYKGRIANLESSLQAAFINIGLDKNAFLHYWDMIPATKETWESDDDDDEEAAEGAPTPPSDEDAKDKKPETRSGQGRLMTKIISLFRKQEKPEPEPPPAREEAPMRRPPPRRREPSRPQEPPISVKDIPSRFAVDSEVIVQVTKGPIGTKGPRVTTNLSIPGRYLVFLPNSSHRGVSKRIEDRAERARLREILRRLSMPRQVGVICRTASVGLDEKSLQMDVDLLMDKWKIAQRDAKTLKAPCCIYKEPDILERTIRDAGLGDVDEIVVDTQASYDLVLSYLKRQDAKDQSRVKLYEKAEPIFDSYRLGNQIQQIYQRTISLPSGAELCIDETEALIAIDVNSKRSRKGKDHPETILNTNLEAAVEIGRQLRLRNIGGLVIIDFIDMRSQQDRNAVYQKMKEVLARDRAKTKILPISRLGLMEMTRQREQESLQDSTFQKCSYCGGKGLMKSSVTVSVEIQRRLQATLRRSKGKIPVRVTVHPDVLKRLKEEDAEILERVESEFGSDLTFRADSELHHEEFVFTNPETGQKIE